MNIKIGSALYHCLNDISKSVLIENIEESEVSIERLKTERNGINKVIVEHERLLKALESILEYREGYKT